MIKEKQELQTRLNYIQVENNILNNIILQLANNLLKVRMAELEDDHDQSENHNAILKNDAKELQERIRLLQEKNSIARDALKRSNIQHAQDEVSIKPLPCILQFQPCIRKI